MELVLPLLQSTGQLSYFITYNIHFPPKNQLLDIFMHITCRTSISAISGSRSRLCSLTAATPLLTTNEDLSSSILSFENVWIISWGVLYVRNTVYCPSPSADPCLPFLAPLPLLPPRPHLSPTGRTQTATQPSSSSTSTPASSWAASAGWPNSWTGPAVRLCAGPMGP